MEHTRSIDLSPELSDELLRLAPVNVLLLDRDLVCRYAAPTGETLYGRQRDDLVGRPVTDVLPPARNGLGRILHRAARQSAAWHHPEYRFEHTEGSEARSCCWSVAVDPVATPEFSGVLVSWTEIAEQAAERERLRGEIQRLRREARERNAALIQVLSDLRNAITPLSGYLQVIARRPTALGGRPAADVVGSLVLPRIADLLAITDRLRRPPIFAVEANATASGAASTPASSRTSS
jgi:hypothetical protein